jgi:hypothetical protein
MTSSQPWWLTWPVAEVAASILPYFSHFPHVSDRRAMKEVVSLWRTGSYPDRESVLGFKIVATAGTFDQFTDPDCGAVAEAIQALEHAGLLMRAVSGDYADSDVGLTRLGQHALATDTVRQHSELATRVPRTDPRHPAFRRLVTGATLW